MSFPTSAQFLAIPAMEKMEFLGPAGVGLVLHDKVESMTFELAGKVVDALGIASTDKIVMSLSNRDAITAALLWIAGVFVGGPLGIALKGLALGFAAGEALNFKF